MSAVSAAVRGALEIFEDLEQGSEEWLRERAGIPTASCFNLVRARPGPRGGTSHKEYQGRRTYLYKLAGEIITGEPMPNFESWDMKRGKENEPAAAYYYSTMNNVPLQRVGFVRLDRCGGSPDYLVGSEGGLEIKDALPHVQIERMDALSRALCPVDIIPDEHLWQCLGLLMVTGRRWWDWMSHCRGYGLKPVIVRVERDERQIASLRVDVEQFNRELDELVQRIRSM